MYLHPCTGQATKPLPSLYNHGPTPCRAVSITADKPDRPLNTPDTDQSSTHPEPTEPTTLEDSATSHHPHGLCEQGLKSIWDIIYAGLGMGGPALTYNPCSQLRQAQLVKDNVKSKQIKNVAHVQDILNLEGFKNPNTG